MLLCKGIVGKYKNCKLHMSVKIYVKNCVMFHIGHRSRVSSTRGLFFYGFFYKLKLYYILLYIYK